MSLGATIPIATWARAWAQNRLAVVVAASFMVVGTSVVVEATSIVVVVEALVVDKAEALVVDKAEALVVVVEASVVMVISLTVVAVVDAAEVVPEPTVPPTALPPSSWIVLSVVDSIVVTEGPRSSRLRDSLDRSSSLRSRPWLGAPPRPRSRPRARQRTATSSERSGRAGWL